MKTKGNGGAMRGQSSKQSKKSKSCENLQPQPALNKPCCESSHCYSCQQQEMPTTTSSLKCPKENDSRSNSVHTCYHKPTDSGRYSHYRHNTESYRGTTATGWITQTHYPYECPVEIQTKRSLPVEERDRLVAEMETEFKAKRKVVLSGLPHGSTEEVLESFFSDFSCTPVSRIKDGTVRVLFPTQDQAKEGIALLNSTMYKCHKLTASFGHADSLLFVGNLPFTYTREDLYCLFSPFGEILRCFIVYSLRTGLSKGYGFVELARREEAVHAKQMMATKVIGLRSLRVDFSDNGMQTVEDLHSQTLFVDRLPKGFKDDDALRELFSEYGRVNFCQVAITMETGVSRGFAFVDMSSFDEAEKAQGGCNGAEFAGQELRVSFGMPCRHGACILQHRNTSVSFNATGKLMDSVRLPLKENYLYHTHSFHQAPLYHAHSETDVISSSVLQPLMDTENIRAGLRKADSASCLSITGLPSLFSSQSCGITQSVSAPTLQTSQSGQTTTAVNWIVDDDIETRKETSNSRPLLGKRLAPSSEVDVSSIIVGGVYDRPYIGQHQQGIPFTHPLKRIRMEQH